jgi:hypothetical protein
MAARSATEKVVALSLTVSVRLVERGAVDFAAAIPLIPDFAAIGAAAWAIAQRGWMAHAAAIAKRVREQKREICGVLMDFSVSRPRRILKLCPW